MIAAWVLLALVAVMTLSPISLRPISPFGPNAERFIAYAAVAMAFAIAYERHFVRAAILIIGSALVLEALQRLAPTRHGEVRDVLIKLAGAALGLVVGKLIILALRRRRTLEKLP